MKICFIALLSAILTITAAEAAESTSGKIVLKAGDGIYREILQARKTVRLPQGEEMVRLCQDSLWNFDGWTTADGIADKNMAPEYTVPDMIPDSVMVLKAVFAWREQSGIWASFPEVSDGVTVNDREELRQTCWHIYKGNYIRLPQTDISKIEGIYVKVKKKGPGSSQINLKITYGDSGVFSLEPLADNNLKDIKVTPPAIVTDGQVQSIILQPSSQATETSGIEIYSIDVRYKTIYSMNPPGMTDPITKVPAGIELDIDGEDVVVGDMTIEEDRLGNIGKVRHDGHIAINGTLTFAKTMDGSGVFCFGLPFGCIPENITLARKDGEVLEYGKDWVIESYSQKERAAAECVTDGWRTEFEKPELKSNTGYNVRIYAQEQEVTLKCVAGESTGYDSRYQVMLRNSNDTDGWYGTDNEDGASDTRPENAGWNMIAIPLINSFASGVLSQDGQCVRFVAVPNKDGMTYTQITLKEAFRRNMIKPFTGFFMQAGGNETPVFDCRTENIYDCDETEECLVEISMTGEDGNTDVTTVIMDMTASRDYEIGKDFAKMTAYAEIPQIYTVCDGIKYAFNSIGPEQDINILIGIYAPKKGLYKISADITGLKGFDVVRLTDNMTGNIHDLRKGDYIAMLDEGEDRERFFLKISEKDDTSVAEGLNDSDMSILSFDGKVVMKQMPENAEIYISDMTGRIIHRCHNDRIRNMAEYSLPHRGTYMVVIKRKGQKSCTFKIVW